MGVEGNVDPILINLSLLIGGVRFWVSREIVAVDKLGLITTPPFLVEIHFGAVLISRRAYLSFLERFE